MNVSKGVLLSIALVSLSAGLMIPPLFQVAVTNFPLDEQGNLRVSQMNGEPQDPSWKVISVVEDYNLTWTPKLSANRVHSPLIDLGTFSVAGYSRMKIYMRITNFTILYQGHPNSAGVRCSFMSVFDYGEYSRSSFELFWEWDNSEQVLFRYYPYTDTMMENVEPSLRLTVRGSSYTPNGPVLPRISCLVSIGIYLRND